MQRKIPEGVMTETSLKADTATARLRAARDSGR
jgi:hypothetical protein